MFAKIFIALCFLFCILCWLAMGQYSLPNTEWTCTLDAFITCQVAKKNIKANWKTLTKVRDIVRKRYWWEYQMHTLLNWLKDNKAITEWSRDREPILHSIVIVYNPVVSWDQVFYDKYWTEIPWASFHAMCVLSFNEEYVEVMVWWEHGIKKMYHWDLNYFYFK